jgi:hypothetical protein
MSLRYVKHFDLNILKLADNLILHGNVFQRMSELYANDFFIIFVIGRITTKLLGADHLTWRGGGGGGYGFLLRSEICFPTQELVYFFFVAQGANFFSTIQH